MPTLNAFRLPQKDIRQKSSEKEGVHLRKKSYLSTT